LKGFQGNKLTDPNTVVADPKHYLGDGGTAWGTSTFVVDGQQWVIDRGVDKLDDATITRLFLPPIRMP